MRLVIAEKPSVSMSIAKVLGATARKESYMEGGGWLVSWCVGHLAGLADAETCDPKYAKWRRQLSAAGQWRSLRPKGAAAKDP